MLDLAKDLLLDIIRPKECNKTHFCKKNQNLIDKLLWKDSLHGL